MTPSDPPARRTHPRRELDDNTEGREDRLLRLVIVAFGGVLLVIMIASVQLSTAAVAFGTVVHGPPALWRGSPTTLRVAAFEPRSGRFLHEVRARASLRDGHGERLRVIASGDGALDLPLAVPIDLDEHVAIDFEVTAAGDTDRFTLDLESRATPPPLAARLPPHAPITPGVHTVTLYPEAGTWVLGLENTVWGLLAEGGRPVSTSIRSDTLGLEDQSDTLGLFRFHYRPVAGRLALRFLVGDRPDAVELTVTPRPTQLQLVLPSGRLVPSGAVLEPRIVTLPFREPVRVDLWAAGALVASATAAATVTAERQVVLPLPADYRGFVRLDAYRDAGAMGEEPITAMLWASPLAVEEAAAEALTAIAKLDGSDPLLDIARRAPPADRERLTSLLLSRIVPEKPGLPLLRSTTAERTATLVASIVRARGYLHRLLGLTAIIGGLVATVWAWRRRRRLRSGLAAVLDESNAATSRTDAVAMTTLRRRQRLDLALAVLVLALFIYAVLGLLTRIRWG